MTTHLNPINENSPSEQDELIRLRELVLGNEYKKAIDQVIEQGFSQNVANILPEAIGLRNQQDDGIAHSLAPVVDKALKKSIKENPKNIVDAIFPIIGASIRRAVSSAILDLLMSINDLIERSVGIKSIQWRYQAWRAKKPYAQYVLLKNFKYRVDQVFLIEKSTGLLMLSIQNKLYQDNDPELVGSMLTAINDFVADSFHLTEEDALERVRFGDRVVQINVGEHIIIALAVTGMVSQTIKQHTLDVLDTIENEHFETINQFAGDSDNVQNLYPLLETCLIEKKHPRTDNEGRPLIAFLLVLAGIIWASYTGFANWQRSNQLDQVVSFVQQMPGTLLTGYNLTDDTATIDIIQDPTVAAAVSTSKQTSANLLPPQLLAELSFAVKFNPVFAQLGSDNVWLTYLQNHYHLDQTPIVDIDNRRLILKGELSASQLESIQNDTAINRFFLEIDIHDITISKAVSQYQKNVQLVQRLVAEINSIHLYFSVAREQLESSELRKVDLLIKNIQMINALPPQSPPILQQLIIYGYTDAAGTKVSNFSLSEHRATYIADYLKSQGIDKEIISVQPLGHIKTTQLSSEQQRRVSFSVIHNPLQPPEDD